MGLMAIFCGKVQIAFYPYYLLLTTKILIIKLLQNNDLMVCIKFVLFFDKIRTDWLVPIRIMFIQKFAQLTPGPLEGSAAHFINLNFPIKS